MGKPEKGSQPEKKQEVPQTPVRQEQGEVPQPQDADKEAIKHKFLKATGKFVEYELYNKSPPLRDHLLFFLRIIAIGIIIAAFLTAHLHLSNNANVPFVGIDQMNSHPTRMVTRLTRVLSNLYLPPYVRTLVIRVIGTAFGVNFKEVLYPLEHFSSWNEFFGRKIIPRPIDKTPFALVAPADSKLLSMQEITTDSTLLVKNITYSIGNFLTGQHGKSFIGEDLSRLHKKKFTKLFSLVFYLSPKDYHRFHSMANCTILERIHIAGPLYPVRESYLEAVRGVLEINERVVLKGEWIWGNIIQTYVAATNVGDIVINLDSTLTSPITSGPVITSKLIGEDLMAGEEVGMFRMGSTVVAIVEVPNDFKWEVTVGQTVKYGQRIGH